MTGWEKASNKFMPGKSMEKIYKNLKLVNINFPVDWGYSPRAREATPNRPWFKTAPSGLAPDLHTVA